MPEPSKHVAARRRVRKDHGHLRRNSGVIKRSANAWVRLSARAIVSTRVGGCERAKACFKQQQADRRPAARVCKFVGDIKPARHAVDPSRFGIGLSVRRRRAPQRLAERGLKVHQPANIEPIGGGDLRSMTLLDSAGAALATRSALEIHSTGGLKFCSLRRPGLHRPSPALFATFSDCRRCPQTPSRASPLRDGGGSSATK